MKRRTQARRVSLFAIGIAAFVAAVGIWLWFPIAPQTNKLVIDLVLFMDGTVCLLLATFWDWPPPKM